MTERPLRIAVIGCGAQGRNHLSAYSKLPGIQIAAVCDTDPSRLEAAANEFGAAGRFMSYEELLRGGSYDLISVCTMPVSHREMVVAALESGAHVLCEKPTAMNLAEAREMAAAAKQAGRMLTAGFNMRFLPDAQLLRRFVADGKLGDPVYTHAWTFATDIPWWGKHYIKQISGGGVLASTAVHILDLALWVAGGPTPVTASASMTQVFPRKRGGTAPSAEAAASFDVEDVFSGHIRFSNGSWMTLEGGWSWDRPDYSYSFEMVGEKATVQLDPLRIMREQDGLPVDVTPPQPESASWETAWTRSIDAEVADVVTALREGREPAVRFDEALKVQAIVDALYGSAASGKEVAIELDES